ncbi:OmpH family outer membrane protein [Candidatus Babeliales bacterium]|nr:OmpH family outer membrane protein [Candidatus Babeliales bacterium]
MNRTSTTTGFMFFSIFFMTNIVYADASSASFGSKATVIVTVSGQEVMMNSETGKAVQDRLKSAQEKLAAPLQKEGEKIQKKDQEIAAKEKDPKADKSALEFEKRELGLQIQKLQAEGQKIEAKLGEMYKKEMAKFENSVKEAIEYLAKTHNWDIVLMEEQVVYVNKKVVSKTSEVIVELDKKTKAANLAKKQALEKDMQKDAAPSSKNEKTEDSDNSY